METTQENTLFRTGTLIADRYEVVRTLGAGGVGMVLQVIDRTLDNETCALKLLFPHLARDKTQFARFRNEVLICRKLGHPNIVRLYDFGIAGRGYYYLSMEFVPGGSLGSRLYSDRYNKPDFQESLKILYEICQGLSCAHRYGIVHRDLKPDNILLTDIGTVKISDFGLARSLTVDKGFTDTGETVGTPYYMAPEQLTGQSPDPRMDIYSLGIMAYEMVVGQRPFVHENYMDLAAMHLYEEIPKFATKQNQVPRWFQDWVQTCGAKRKEKRFQTADEAGEVLAAHLNDEANNTVRRLPAVYSFYSTRTKTVRSRKRKLKRLAAIVLFLTLCGAGVLGGAAWFTSREPATLGRFLAAAIQGDETVVEELLASGNPQITANARDLQKNSVLALAIKQGKVDVVELLLRNGADPNSEEPSGLTAFLLACRQGRADVVEKLLSTNVDLMAKDTQGNSALHLAVTEGHTEVVRTLIRFNAPKHLQDAHGVSPLMAAVKSKNMPIVSLLIEAGAQVNQKDDRGNTPLIIAVRQDSRQLVEKLLASNADVYERNNEGKTAIDYASRDIRSILQRVQPAQARTAASASAASPVIVVRGSEPEQAGGDGASIPVSALRIFGSPTTVWQFLGGNPRHDVQVTIKNLGDEPAKGVTVAVRKGDKEFPLNGPDELRRTEQAVYSKRIEGLGSPDTRVSDSDLVIRCRNCR